MQSNSSPVNVVLTAPTMAPPVISYGSAPTAQATNQQGSSSNQQVSSQSASMQFNSSPVNVVLPATTIAPPMIAYGAAPTVQQSNTNLQVLSQTAQQSTASQASAQNSSSIAVSASLGLSLSTPSSAVYTAAAQIQGPSYFGSYGAPVSSLPTATAISVSSTASPPVLSSNPSLRLMQPSNLPSYVIPSDPVPVPVPTFKTS